MLSGLKVGLHFFSGTISLAVLGRGHVFFTAIGLITCYLYLITSLHVMNYQLHYKYYTIYIIYTKAQTSWVKVELAQHFATERRQISWRGVLYQQTSAYSLKFELGLKLAEKLCTSPPQKLAKRAICHFIAQNVTN
ncbi:hypothetical protein ACJX0J_029280 [Zea mays]